MFDGVLFTSTKERDNVFVLFTTTYLLSQLLVY
jgi:hypothetical protein